TVCQMVYKYAISTLVPSRPVLLPSGDQPAEQGNS
ncbi:RNA chaperone Hfq, partial [Pseudomonas aeruginosa]